MKTKKLRIEPFSDRFLVVLISAVTLLLQLISFATTRNGSKVYLDGIFPYAALLFAVAIQSTAYFLSNSLRRRISFLKITAMTVALCCSTYYSYIGIYHSVNSPVSYLQENYLRISDEMTRIFDAELENNLALVRETVSDATSRIRAEHSALITKQQTIADCRQALSEISETYSDGMRPPRQSAYENYEDYVAAYNAYIAGMSAGTDTENTASRTQVLSSYGFASMEELNQAELENNAAISALTAALDGVTLDVSFDSNDSGNISALLQAAKLCGYTDFNQGDILNTLALCDAAAAAPTMPDYPALVASLPEGQVTTANMGLLKNNMDSEILTALIRINSLLPETEQLSFSDSRFQIRDLYLIPVYALSDTATQPTALFCLGVAALIDALSVLFAVSLRPRRPVWKKRLLLFGSPADYKKQIFASLPAGTASSQALADFLACFTPSPYTESDGFMMQATLSSLTPYASLSALLCQINLAKIIPAGFLENDTEILLLKARFVFWANEQIYDHSLKETEVPA